uniref:AIP1f n=1 Tax=Volvox carteri f. nagariensis TaxID=3068 RepID=D9CIY3_VOLCA|nr:AIP1f [Volvox carteri f. nagariensis]
MSGIILGGPTVSRAPRVLVAGAPHVGKSKLCQVLTGTEDSPHGKCVPWTIQTKYYTSNVEVCEVEVCEAQITTLPEALLLVFNLSAPNTFESLQSFVKNIDLNVVEFKLLCGTYADALIKPGCTADSLDTAFQPDWFHMAMRWSFDNGFEFVICCPSMPELDATLILDGDRHGVLRVMEALRTHPWSFNGPVPKGLFEPIQEEAPKRQDLRRGGVFADMGYKEAVKPIEDNAGHVEPVYDERIMDGFELLMADIVGHKANLASLPNEERREQASLLALRMLEVLGFDDEQNEGDDA